MQNLDFDATIVESGAGQLDLWAGIEFRSKPFHESKGLGLSGVEREKSWPPRTLADTGAALLANCCNPGFQLSVCKGAALLLSEAFTGLKSISVDAVAELGKVAISRSRQHGCGDFLNESLRGRGRDGGKLFKRFCFDLSRESGCLI